VRGKPILENDEIPEKPCCIMTILYVISFVHYGSRGLILIKLLTRAFHG
jgi:hypothetical protein